MESKYLNLCKELARATAVTAEQVMDYNHNQNDEQGLKTAETMRDDFQKLYDKLTDEKFDGTLTKAEYAKLLVGAYIINNNLRTKVAELKKSIQGYEEELIPRLQKIIDSSEDQYLSVAEEILTIEDNN